MAARAQRFRGRLAAARGDIGPLAEHGELLTEAGRSDEAAPLLTEAREVFERLRATVWLERLDTTAAVLSG
jgi:hypothetical protein